MKVSNQLHPPTALPPLPEELETGWVFQAQSRRLGEDKHALPMMGFEPLTVQPVAYASYAIPAATVTF